MLLRLEYASANTISEDKLYGMIHKCKKCLYSTKSLFFIKNHVRSHQCADPLEWFDCSKNDLECFFCVNCNFITYQNTTFKDHLKNHIVKSENPETDSQMQAENAFKCEDYYYSETFTKTNLKELESSLKELKWFCCDKCPYKSKALRPLYYHKITHHGLIPNDNEWFHCDQCQFQSKREYALHEHFIKQHSLKKKAALLEEAKLFECQYCTFETRNKYYLKKHIDKHLTPDNIDWLQCGKCSFKSKFKRTIKNHMLRIHHLREVQEIALL